MTKVMNINKEETKELNEVQDVETNKEESKASKTLEQLKEERKKLEEEVDQDGKDLATALYEIDFVEEKNINSVLKWFDKNLEWDIKSAALNVTLCDTLKSEKARIREATEDKDKLVRLNSILLNALYTGITKITGKGISQAKTFLTLLTAIGNNISEQMNKMAENNRLVQDKHVLLQELDTEISTLENPSVEADEIKESNS